MVHWGTGSGNSWGDSGDVVDKSGIDGTVSVSGSVSVSSSCSVNSSDSDSESTSESVSGGDSDSVSVSVSESTNTSEPGVSGSVSGSVSSDTSVSTNSSEVSLDDWLVSMFEDVVTSVTVACLDNHLFVAQVDLWYGVFLVSFLAAVILILSLISFWSVRFHFS